MPNPQFSVVIPTCRRNDLLARCLESLAPGVQEADAACYEVIVTDDARDNTAEPMIRSQFPWATWIQGPRRGPAANRNNGARHARGEWVCFIDDDCIASKQWIAAFQAGAPDNSIDLMEGRTDIPDNVDNPFYRGVHNREGGAYWSCNLAVRREPFMAIGGFDEDFLEAASEDMEFAFRYHANHLRSKFFPDAYVDHPVRAIGFRGNWKRLFMIKWDAMYEYKIDQGLHLSDPPIKNLTSALSRWIITQLRLSWQDLRRWNEPYWKSRTFSFVLRWITYPIILPYYLYWVYRFQEQLSSKQHVATA
jgi:GT2 family glycosyltransferase